MTVRKWEVIDTLRRQKSLRSMVQILTPSTGSDMHGRPELARFTSSTTLMYASHQQRLELEDAKVLPTLEQLEDWCSINPLRADLVFIDSWHTYDDSVRSLRLAFSILQGGGFIVMHDCDPPTAEAARPLPESCNTLWCGEAWRAFVEVTSSLANSSEWFVVESDLGVGVINVPPPTIRRLFTRSRRRVITDGPDFGWSWLADHREEALHPMSIEDWQEFADR